MKFFLASCFLIANALNLSAQDFPGYRAGNYTGVNGVFFNPANIADSRYRYDINLFSVSTFAGNDKASFKLKSFLTSASADSMRNQLVGANAGISTGMAHVDIHGPSFMFNAGKKSSVAITTRARTLANVINLDGRLAEQLNNDLRNNAQLPYTISSNENMEIAINSWTEFGASFGRILSERGQHFLKGGVTLKYLAGVANGYIDIGNFKGTINDDILLQDAYLSNTTGRVSAGFGGIEISDFEVDDAFQLEGVGFGGDIGFVYEYRPQQDNAGNAAEMRDRNKYKFRAGLAVLDLGKVKYKTDPSRSGGYEINITGSERFYLKQLSQTNIDDYDSFFRTKPQFFTPITSNDGDYSVSLPSTLQLDLDYHLHRGFYASLAAQLPLVTNADFSGRYYSSFTLTPRYEGKAFGVYLPINHNSLTQFNAGLSLRAGPLFLGSGSILSAVLGDSKQADVHIGLRFGGLQKDEQKREEKRAGRAEKRRNKAERENE